MWTIIVIVILFTLFIMYIGKEADELGKKQLEYQKEMDRKRGYRFIERHTVDYLGGFKSLEPQRKVNLEICSDRIKLHTDKVQNILYRNIVDVGIKTENEIRERVSLGKLICFGVLAFAMKGKEEVSSKSYLMITAVDGGEHIGVLLDSNSNAGIVTAINIAKNDYLKNI